MTDKYTNYYITQKYFNFLFFKVKILLTKNFIKITYTVR